MATDFFYGARGDRTKARVMIVAESWGKQEAMQQLALVGESGQDLDRLLPETKLPYETFLFTNVCPARPENNEMANFFFRTTEARATDRPFIRGCYPHPIVLNGIFNLERQIAELKPDLIIGLGNYALWALTEDCFKVKDEDGKKLPSGIGSWRGSQIYTREILGHKYRFLPTYHPAAALRAYPWRYMLAHDLRVRVPMAFTGQWEEPEHLFTIRPSFDQTTQFILDTLCLLDNSPDGLDVVTDLEFRDGMIACVGLALNKFSAFCIPLMTVDSDEGYFSREEEFQVSLLLRKLLTHPNIRLQGQNLLADFQMFVAWLFCRPKIAFDTMVAHHVCWPGGGDPTSSKAFAQGIQRKALFNLSSLYCDHHYFWKDEIKFWEKGLPEETFWTYNCRDCIKTFECATELKRLVSEFQLEEQCQFQHDVANEMLLDMMIRGIRLLPDQRAEVTRDLRKALDVVDANLESLVPAHLIPQGKTKGSKPWYRSPTKQKTLFYETLGIKPVINKKTGKPTFSKEAMPTIVKREPLLRQVADRIAFRRSVGVFHNTFAEMPADSDGRMRCSYNLTGTDTFRLSSSENIFGNGGNMQNVPAGKTIGENVTLPEELERFDAEFKRFEFPNMRKQFGPDIGYEIAEFDLSGADAQVVAWEADDEDLKAAFRAGLKLHIKNARDVYPEKYGSWTDEEIKKTDHSGGVYHNMKRWVHATNYVGSAFEIANRVVGSNEKDVAEFQDRWFSIHPGIKGWHNRKLRELQGLQCWNCDILTDGGSIHCHNCGRNIGRTVGNQFGFRIIYFDRIQGILPEAVAWTPQSTVAINCNKSALALRRKIDWVELLLQTHDSLTVQYPIKYHERLGEVKEALHSVIVPYYDPLVIPWSAKVSRISWGHCEPITW